MGEANLFLKLFGAPNPCDKPVRLQRDAKRGADSLDGEETTIGSEVKQGREEKRRGQERGKQEKEGRVVQRGFRRAGRFSKTDEDTERVWA